jgi:hypothetical protein
MFANNSLLYKQHYNQQVLFLGIKVLFLVQKGKLFPTIYTYWQKCQSKMLEKLKDLKDGIAIAGDGRHDSMAHCALHYTTPYFVVHSP